MKSPPMGCSTGLVRFSALEGSANSSEFSISKWGSSGASSAFPEDSGLLDAKDRPKRPREPDAVGSFGPEKRPPAVPLAFDPERPPKRPAPLEDSKIRKR